MVKEYHMENIFQITSEVSWFMCPRRIGLQGSGKIVCSLTRLFFTRNFQPRERRPKDWYVLTGLLLRRR